MGILIVHLYYYRRCCSDRYCSPYVFKKTEGISFQKYVNFEKLEAIKNLMEKEHVHLYEAAALFGYTDPNYVSRLFKKYYGYNITDKQNRHPTIVE